VDNGTVYVAYRNKFDWTYNSEIMVKKYNDVTGEWNTVGRDISQEYDYINSVGRGADPSIYVYNGVPYIAYDESNIQTGCSVEKYNSQDKIWERVGEAAFPIDEIADPVLLISEGIPYVAYQDRSHGTNITVMRFLNNTWTSVGEPCFAPDNVEYISLSIFQNYLYVCFADNSTLVDYWNGRGATVLKYSLSGK
jgi:hypothetical protein